MGQNGLRLSVGGALKDETFLSAYSLPETLAGACASARAARRVAQNAATEYVGRRWQRQEEAII